MITYCQAGGEESIAISASKYNHTPLCKWWINLMSAAEMCSDCQQWVTMRWQFRWNWILINWASNKHVGKFSISIIIENKTKQYSVGKGPGASDWSKVVRTQDRHIVILTGREIPRLWEPGPGAPAKQIKDFSLVSIFSCKLLSLY